MPITPGVYQFNSIFNNQRCIDLDTGHNPKRCYKQPQKGLGNQYWNFNLSPAAGFWDIRWAGNADLYLTPYNSDLELAVLPTSMGLAPAWSVQEVAAGQYLVYTNVFNGQAGGTTGIIPNGFVDYWSGDGDSGPIHVTQTNAPDPIIELRWGLQYIRPLPGETALLKERMDGLEARLAEIERSARKTTR